MHLFVVGFPVVTYSELCCTLSKKKERLSWQLIASFPGSIAQPHVVEKSWAVEPGNEASRWTQGTVHSTCTFSSPGARGMSLLETSSCCMFSSCNKLNSPHVNKIWAETTSIRSTMSPSARSYCY